MTVNCAQLTNFQSEVLLMKTHYRIKFRKYDGRFTSISNTSRTPEIIDLSIFICDVGASILQSFRASNLCFSINTFYLNTILMNSTIKFDFSFSSIPVTSLRTCFYNILCLRHLRNLHPLLGAM